MLHYAAADSWRGIFNDLAIPNNHPLHSLLVRWSVELTGAGELAVRLPALIAMAATWLLVPLLAFHLTNDRVIAFLATVWALTSAPLLHYAEASRGYALQTFLVVLFAWFVLRANRGDSIQGRRLGWAVIVGLAAILTLPTSVIFIAPIGLYDLTRRYLDWRKVDLPTKFFSAERRALVAYAILALMGGMWLWRGASQFAQGRQTFGTPIESFDTWTTFVGEVTSQIWGWPLVVLIAAGLLMTRDWRLSLFLVLTLIFPFLVAPLTRGGGARVYLALAPFGFIAAAIAVSRAMEVLVSNLKLRSAIVVLLALVPLLWMPRSLKHWTSPDWRAAAKEICRVAPADGYIVYPATDGLVLQFYGRKEYQSDVVNRVPLGDEFTLVIAGNNGRLSGIVPKTMQSDDVELTKTGATSRVLGVPLWTVRARRVTERNPNDNVVFVAIGPDRRDAVRARIKEMLTANSSAQWVVLNGLLSDALMDFPQVDDKTAVLLVGWPGKLADGDWKKLAAHSGTPIRFYSSQP